MAETMLFKVSTTNPWELGAYVPFGGWNECPKVKEMMAVCKYWYEKYGAVPVTISHDEMETTYLRRCRRRMPFRWQKNILHLRWTEFFGARIHVL